MLQAPSYQHTFTLLFFSLSLQFVLVIYGARASVERFELISESKIEDEKQLVGLCTVCMRLLQEYTLLTQVAFLKCIFSVFV